MFDRLDAVSEAARTPERQAIASTQLKWLPLERAGLLLACSSWWRNDCEPSVEAASLIGEFMRVQRRPLPAGRAGRSNAVTAGAGTEPASRGPLPHRTRSRQPACASANRTNSTTQPAGWSAAEWCQVLVARVVAVERKQLCDNSLPARASVETIAQQPAENATRVDAGAHNELRRAPRRVYRRR